MASSAKTLTAARTDPPDEWTTVLPRRGKRRRNFPKPKSVKLQEEQKIWAPEDLDTCPEREMKLMTKIEMCVEKVESSPFFLAFLDQIRAPDVMDRFLQVLGSERSMKMVIYGIGSVELFEPPRIQLSLAILMKRKLGWIGEVEVFDPIISLTESRILEFLGVTVLQVNEHGKRQALKPILFFMPHCEAELYENLLQANWKGEMLDRIIIFGNSFETYAHYASMFSNSKIGESRKHLLAVRRFTREVIVHTISDDYFRAFQGLSWHFFSVCGQASLDHFETL